MIGNDTVEIVKRTDTEERGRFNTPIAAPDTYITVTGCSVQIDTADEKTNLTQIVGVTAKVFMPVTNDTTNITARDAIRFNGRTYEVTGPSLTATDLNGDPDHTWCLIKWQAS